MKALSGTPDKPKTAVWITGFCLALVAGIAVVLFFFDPTRNAIYPVCYFHKLTGWHCPGCGSLRALHHLTHGELAAAFHCNPLLLVSLPVIGWLFGHGLIKRHNSTGFAQSLKSVTLWIVIGVIMLFGVLRNLPHPAFAWMSP
jgi:hypothetical protein